MRGYDCALLVCAFVYVLCLFGRLFARPRACLFDMCVCCCLCVRVFVFCVCLIVQMFVHVLVKVLSCVCCC